MITIEESFRIIQKLLVSGFETNTWTMRLFSDSSSRSGSPGTGECQPGRRDPLPFDGADFEPRQPMKYHSEIKFSSLKESDKISRALG
jgi:hypothetical protein